jgi:hypothetical protein
MSLRFPLVPCDQVGLPCFADRIRSNDLSEVQAVGDVAAAGGGAVGGGAGGVGGSAGAVAGARTGQSSGMQHSMGGSSATACGLSEIAGKSQQDAGQIEGRSSATPEGSKGHSVSEFGDRVQPGARDEAGSMGQHGAALQSRGEWGELSENELAFAKEVAERVCQDLADPYGDIVPAAAKSPVYAPRKHLGLERQFGSLAGRMIAPEVLEVGDDAWCGFVGLVRRGR